MRKNDPYELAESVRYIDDVKKNNQVILTHHYQRNMNLFNPIQVLILIQTSRQVYMNQLKNVQTI